MKTAPHKITIREERSTPKRRTRKSSYEAKLETLKRKEIRKFKYQKH